MRRISSFKVDDLQNLFTRELEHHIRHQILTQFSMQRILGTPTALSVWEFLQDSLPDGGFPEEHLEVIKLTDLYGVGERSVLLKAIQREITYLSEYVKEWVDHSGE